MKNRVFWAAVALMGATALFVGRAGAQDEDEGCGCGCGCEMEEGCDEGCGEGGGEAGAAMGGMPAWMNLTEEHKDLGKLAGEWSAVVDFTPMGMGKTEGSASAKMILGGRFIQQSFKGQVMGQPFEGLLHIGYDTVTKQYVSTWMDSMSPFLYVSRGVKKDGELSMAGKEPDMTGTKLIDSRMVTKWVNENQYTVTFYSSMTGNEMKTGVITYTRKQ